MKFILVLIFTILSLSSPLFGAIVQPTPVISQFIDEGFKPWMFTASDSQFQLMSVKNDLTQAIVVKPTPYWDQGFKAHTWYDVPEGSAYFLEEANVAIYIFDFDKKAVSAELKNSVINILKKSLSQQTSKIQNSFFSLFPSAYAADNCPNGLNDHQVNKLIHFSKSLNKAVQPVGAEVIFNKLATCGKKVIQETWDDLVKMTTNPIGFLKDTWKGLSSIVDFVANFQTAIPKVLKQLNGMSAAELFDMLCPVMVKMALGVFTGKLAYESIHLAKTILAEVKLIKNLSLKSLIKIPKKPDLPHLKIVNGRTAQATIASQKECLAKLSTSGEITIAGKKLTPHTTYAGVVLDDGRLLLTPKNHQDLIRAGDKIGTALEIRTDKAGKIFFGTNQSSTLVPTFKPSQKWLKFWTEKQMYGKKAKFVGNEGDGLPFFFAEYMN